ncbi:MAG: hypothetical protein H8K10_13955 [Nitrospira sp.]|nr:hypothetical protein [Nitrospira sp.]
MAKAERLQLIRSIEAERGTCLISYITSTRQQLEVQMAIDSVRRIFDHLSAVKSSDGKIKVDLFLCSNGGDGIVPWRLVTLIREYAEKFSVLVPYRAFSAATLTALGADSIIMHPMGMLGPTDPTVTNSFNPVEGGQRIGISVEDVTAYIALIKEDAGIQHEEELVQAFNKLSDKVHPLALGNVKRSLSQSRMMAEKLLSLHMDGQRDAHKISEIVDNFTSKLFYHGHPINRREARDLGLATVEDPSPSVEEAMWKLYLDYEREIKTEEPFNVASEFVALNPQMQPGQQALTPMSKAKLAFVESSFRTDVFSLNYQLSGAKGTNGVTTVQMITHSQGWQGE